MNKTVKEEIWDKVMINFVGGSYHTRKEVAQATDQIMTLIRGIMVDEGEILTICIRELWHPDLFDDLKIDPLDMDKRQTLKATAKILAHVISQHIRDKLNDNSNLVD